MFTESIKLSLSISSDTIPSSVMTYCKNQNHLSPIPQLVLQKLVTELVLRHKTTHLQYFNPLLWLKSPMQSKYNSFIHFRHQQIPLTLVKPF